MKFFLKLNLIIALAIFMVGNTFAQKQTNEVGFEPIFNGKDFSGWESVRNLNSEGTTMFFIDENENAIHTYKGKEANSNQPTDCLYSKKEYSSYVLKLEYKWLEKRFEPRMNQDRDAGLLFHIHDNMKKVWPYSLEMQLGESDVKKRKERYTTGDLWVIGKNVQVMNERGPNSIYTPGVEPVVIGKDKKYDNSFISEANEKPHGEWNEITLTVRGADEAIFELNGKVVNRITDMSYEVDGERVPLEKGRIGIQAEYAELMYRNIRIKELAPQPKPVEPRVWKSGADSEFEVGTQIRAWTIKDEGMAYILDNMQSMCGVNSLYMVAVMHKEHRPFRAPEFPHNPARDTWDAEDSRVTFFPDTSRYGKLKPLFSDTAWIRETDWLQLMIDSCRARGMAVGAEVSHFPIPHALLQANPDWLMKTIDGEIWRADRLCPNNPEVREYLIALYGDLAANYDLDYIQTCQLLFRSNDIDDKGACFCKHCIAEAKATGFDLEAAIPILKKDKNAEPQRSQWLQLRKNTSTKLYKDISEKIKQENPNCHLRLNDVLLWGGQEAIDCGLDIKAIAPYLGSIVNQDHTEQKGRATENFALRNKWLTLNRDLLGSEKPLVCGIAPRMEATPELVKAGIKVALEHPANVNGLALKHYDGASFGLMRAFKQGMIEAGVQGLKPIIGKEVEEMELVNFKKVDDYVEEWGVETTGKATASYSFDNSSGMYDIRISYFDEKVGDSKVQLLVGGKKVINFKLNEDAGCWRWKLFENIQVNKGDEIKFVVKATGKETVRLDFVEFIPYED